MNAMLDCVVSAAISWALLRFVVLPPVLRWTLCVLGTLAVWSASWTVATLWDLAPWAVDTALLLVAIASKALASSRNAKREPQDSDRVEKLAFFAICVIATSALIEHLMRYPDGGNDAFIIWNLRARWLFRAADQFKTAFSPEILFWAHPDYPLLLPALVVRGFTAIGRETAAIPGVVAVLFAACSVAVVVGGAPHRRRWLAGLAMVTTPALVMLAATEQADVPLAAFLGASVAVLIVRQPGDLRALVAAGAFASMAAWTKNEGSLHFLLIAAAVVLQERRLKPLLAFVAGSLPFLALLIAFKLSNAPANDLLGMTVASALRRALSPERWWTLLTLSLRRLSLLQVWGLHLVALLVFLIIGRRYSRMPPHLTFLSYVPAAAMFVHAAILLGQPHDLTFMFKVTIDRLLIELWPAIILLVFARISSPSELVASSHQHGYWTKL